MAKDKKKVNASEDKKKKHFWKDYRAELKKVKWPTAKDVLKYTISTIVFCIILCCLFMLLNLILSVVKGWLA